VEALLRQGFFSPQRDPSLRVGEPLVVSHPDGGQHSWLVPLLIGVKLAGFAQLLPSLTPLGVSSFRRDTQDCDSCPDAAEWTDTDRIRARAASMARHGEQLSEPLLTFDQHPSRIAWRVLATPPAGPPRILFVAGTTVYERGGSGLG
jgi:hypothetical protein